MIAADRVDSDGRQAAEAEEQALLNPGDVVGGRYVLTRVLGRGAAGTVWEAEHRLLTSRVAVKFLDTAALLDPTSAEILAQRFRFEAQISARLGNGTKHLVAAHDAGMFRGIPYLVMELVDGETLDARLMQAPMSLVEAADMLDQLAEPIDGAHAVGIAHRDIKPGNVMIVKTSTGPFYKLGDWGTAKTFGEGLVGLTPPKQTSENTLVGSPAYMSPEYISGVPLVTGAIDVWALSVTAYETITGKLPFDGEVWTQVAVAIVGGEFPPPSSLVESIPTKLDEVFARAFSQEPQQRFTNARHFARAFRQATEQPVAAPKPVEADEVDALELPKTNTRRLWGYGAITLCVGLAVVIGALLLGGKSSDSQSATSPTKASALPDETAARTNTNTPLVVATAKATSTEPADSVTVTSSAQKSATPSSKHGPKGPRATVAETTPPPPPPVHAPPPPRVKPSVNPSEIH